MTLTNDELVKRLAGKLQKPEHAVSEELNALVQELNDAVSKGEEYIIDGIGTFRVTNGELVFEPDAILAIEINHKYAGMEDIEILGADKEGKDEEIEPKEKEDKSDGNVPKDEDEWSPIHFDDPNISNLTDLKDETTKGKNGNGKHESEIKEQLDEVKRKVRQLESDEGNQNEEEPFLEDSEDWDDSANDDENKIVYEGNQEEDHVIDEAVPKEPVVEDPKEEKPPKKKKKRVKRRSRGERTVSGSVAIIVGILGVFFVVGLVWILVTYNGNQPNANVLLGENATQKQTSKSNAQPQRQQPSSGNNQNNGGGLFANPQPGSSNSNSDNTNTAKRSNSQSMRMKTSSPQTSNQTPTTPPTGTSSNNTNLFGLKGDLSPKNTDFYTIVVYSLTDHKRAEEVRNNLSSKNYRVSLTRSRLNNQYIYRVGLGQFKNTASAEQAAKGLPSKFRDNHFIKHVHLKSTNE